MKQRLLAPGGAGHVTVLKKPEVQPRKVTVTQDD